MQECPPDNHVRARYENGVPPAPIPPTPSIPYHHRMPTDHARPTTVVVPAPPVVVDAALPAPTR